MNCQNCQNCIYFDESEHKCEAGSEPEGCESHQEILDMNDLSFLDDVVED